ncbi:16456_t:CDS:1 [Acaulospora morrowiae]|uniref:16456_t:CDS:1 n=1 Tax=Acaulospora morrowiae TaxID=94023 RepID=A0A9N9BPC8_9GLOM|nr:16456_t:CDS:1 [Acaulospora morrowiae]
MSVNSLTTRFYNDEKEPDPMEGESYFYRHYPVKFSVEIKNAKNATTKHSAYGMVFITDKRIMFIAEEPTPDGFDTFHIFLGDVVSSVRQINKYFRKNVFSVTITLRTGVIINMDIAYDLEDIEDKRIFEDYYGMLVTWAARTVPERYRTDSRVSGVK